MTTNYDPALVIATLGPIPITGYADGTYISVVRNEETFSLRVGVTGESVRSKNNNKSGRITFTLLQSAACNDLLSAQMNLDELSPMGDAIVPFTLTDLSGRTVLVAEKAWLVKQADVTYSKEGETREWLVETDAIVMQVGGNN